jgi:hypothetical protein
MADDSSYFVDELTRLAEELAALVRQYGRALYARDSVAKKVEAEAISDRVRWLVYNHLALQVGITSDDWVWLNAGDDYCLVERCEEQDLRVRGRFWCSLPEGLRQWTEPFAADIQYSPTAPGLCGYTVWFGSRATMPDLATVRRQVASDEVLNPRAPEREEEWAFVFRMGEHA